MLLHCCCIVLQSLTVVSFYCIVVVAQLSKELAGLPENAVNAWLRDIRDEFSRLKREAQEHAGVAE